jgi:hypothetical protein
MCSGRGIFFFIHACVVFLLRREENGFALGALFSSLYVDKYGEEDIGFLRGKPLFLDQQRLNSLKTIWLSHSFDQEVIKRDQKRYKL